MKTIIQVLLLIVGLINFFPVIGVISADVLVKLYGGEILTGDLLILMRHRAILFGIVGGFIIISAFRPALQTAAIVMGFVTLVGFEILALGADNLGDKLYRVAMIDIAAIIALAIAAILRPRLKNR